MADIQKPAATIKIGANDPLYLSFLPALDTAMVAAWHQPKVKFFLILLVNQRGVTFPAVRCRAQVFWTNRISLTKHAVVVRFYSEGGRVSVLCMVGSQGNTQPTVLPNGETDVLYVHRAEMYRKPPPCPIPY